jgi:hypothetical protein
MQVIEIEIPQIERIVLVAMSDDDAAAVRQNQALLAHVETQACLVATSERKIVGWSRLPGGCVTLEGRRAAIDYIQGDAAPN